MQAQQFYANARATAALLGHHGGTVSNQELCV
jgi:hypothetical protein